MSAVTLTFEPMTFESKPNQFVVQLRKYLCKVWLNSIHMCTRYRIRKIFGHHWLTLTFEPTTFSLSYLLVTNYDQLHSFRRHANRWANSRSHSRTDGRPGKHNACTTYGERRLKEWCCTRSLSGLRFIFVLNLKCRPRSILQNAHDTIRWHFVRYCVHCSVCCKKDVEPV